MALNESQKKERADYLEKNLKITECSQGQPYAFISYASDNWEKVFKEAVVPLQQTYGLCVYADKAFDKVNDKWIVPMLRNVRGADVIIVFVSQKYIESYACFLELLTAVNSKKQIVFISLEDELHLGNTTDQPDVERGVKNEILNQGANISTNTNNTSNDLMRAMKSAYTSISTLLEQDALSRYDISDAFINFFRDASVNRKTINDLKAVKRTISSLSKDVFDKMLIISQELPADPTDAVLQAAPQTVDGNERQTEAQGVTAQGSAAAPKIQTEGQEDNTGTAARPATPVFSFSERKKGSGNKRRPIIIAAVAAAVLLAGFVIFMIFGGFNRIRASRMCKEGAAYLSQLDYVQASTSFQEAVDTYPKAVDAYIGLANSYIGQGDYQSALEALEKGV